MGSRPPRFAVLVRAVLAASLAVIGLGLATPQQAAAASTGQVFIIHGLIGQVLDVFVDGKNVCPDAKPKMVVGPLKLAAGKHRVELRKGSSVVVKSSFSVAAGASTDLIAHAVADSASGPGVTAFSNDLGAVAPGKVRLAVAHTAAAPPADIRVDGKVLFSNVANGEGLTVVVPAKTYSVDIVPTASDGAAILGPVSLTLKAGTLTRVFAIGSVNDKTMDAVVHVLPVRQAGAGTPNRVATGDGGQAATEFVRGASALPLAGAVALLAGLMVAIGWNRRLRRSVGRATARSPGR